MKNLRWSWGSIPSKLSYRRLVIIIIITCEYNLVGWLVGWLGGRRFFLNPSSINREAIHFFTRRIRYGS